MIKIFKYIKRQFFIFISPTRPTITYKEYLSLKFLIKSPAKVLNVGSSSFTLLGSKFWNIIPGEYSLIILDLFPGENVDVVADAENMPFDNGTFDLVVCQAVLEHVQNPKNIINEINRVLKKQGLFYCTEIGRAHV